MWWPFVSAVSRGIKSSKSSAQEKEKVQTQPTSPIFIGLFLCSFVFFVGLAWYGVNKGFV